MKFNLNKFNIASTKPAGIVGNSLIELDTEIKNVQKKMFSIKLDAECQIDAAIESSVLKKYFNGSTSFSLDSKSNSGIKIYNFEKLNSDIEILSNAVGSNIGEEFISLENITLKPGQELIINTCDLTATVNGENAISNLGVGSDFFDFISGANEITISGTNSNGITVNVFWKDRWL